MNLSLNYRYNLSFFYLVPYFAFIIIFWVVPSANTYLFPLVCYELWNEHPPPRQKKKNQSPHRHSQAVTWIGHFTCKCISNSCEYSIGVDLKGMSWETIPGYNQTQCTDGCWSLTVLGQPQEVGDTFFVYLSSLQEKLSTTNNYGIPSGDLQAYSI